MQETRSALVVAPTAWRTARLSVLFAFDVSHISRGDGDLLEPVLLTAILQANQAALHHDPDLQLRYGDASWSLPDEHRRPISINAVAQSLGLPFETVRRRTRALAERGLCVATTGGLYVPQAAVTSQPYRDVQARRTARMARLHSELVEEGLQPPNPAIEPFVAASARAADRLLGDYMLRACTGLLELTGSAMDGMVLLALCATNIADLNLQEVTGWASYGQLARACSAGRLAAALAMPNETVRRHLHRLADRGFCRRTRGGWMAAAPPDGQALLGRLVAENARDLHRLFAGLTDLASRAGADLGRRAL